MKSLESILIQQNINDKLVSCLVSIAKCGMKISKIQRFNSYDYKDYTNNINIKGQQVNRMDLKADMIIEEELRSNGNILSLLSEERVKPVIFTGYERKYIVAVDPLDGSSNLDSNMITGSIFSIYGTRKFDNTDFFQGLKEQSAAVYFLYGPTTLMVYTVGNGVHILVLGEDNDYHIYSTNVLIPNAGNIYSCNESYINNWNTGIYKFITKYIKESNKFVLRYSGCMVADIHRILIKGGIFLYPTNIKTNTNKLRVLYEIAPMSFIIEQASGKSIMSINEYRALDYIPSDLHECSDVYMGGSDLVNNFIDYMHNI